MRRLFAFVAAAAMAAASAAAQETSEEEEAAPPVEQPRGSASDDLVLGAVGALLFFLVAVCAGRAVWTWARVVRDREWAAQRRAESEKRFVAFVFHELRNPLNGVLSYLEFVHAACGQLRAALEGPAAALAEGRTLARQCEADAVAALSSAYHALDVLNNVLDLARLADGKLELERRPVNLEELARGVVSMTRAVKPALGVSVEFSAGREVAEAVGGVDAAAWVASDARRLRQILVNLVSNAVKFTEAGGVRVFVHAAEVVTAAAAGGGDDDDDDEAAAPMAARRRPSSVELQSAATTLSHSVSGASSAGATRVEYLVAVCDTGPGVPPRVQEQLFSSFSTHGNKAGSGLGLMLSQRMVELLGGSIEITSPYVCPVADSPDDDEVETAGAMFSFRFQADVCAAPADAPPAAGPPGSLDLDGDLDDGLDAGTVSPTGLASRSHEEALRWEEVRRDERAIWMASAAAVAEAEAEAKNNKEEEEEEKKQDKIEVVVVEAAPAEEAAAAPEDKADDMVMHGLRYLIVDDVPMNRKVMRRRLGMGPFKGLGGQCEEAATGEATLELLREGQRYDVIVLDEVLTQAGGVLTGSETAGLVRALEAERGLEPAVLVSCSGNCTDADTAVYLARGVDLAWPKPVPRSASLHADLLGVRLGRRGRLPDIDDVLEVDASTSSPRSRSRPARASAS